MDTGFPAERTHFFQASIKSAQPFPAQNCGHEFYGHEDFLKYERQRKNQKRKILFPSVVAVPASFRQLGAAPVRGGQAHCGSCARSLKAPGVHRPCCAQCCYANAMAMSWTKKFGKREKTLTPKTRFSILEFTKDPRPLYYKTPPYVFYHKNECSKAVFGP